METKKKIRREILALRDKLSGEERIRLSSEIFRRIENLPDFQKADKLLLFAGYGSEPDTLPLHDKCIARGKRVYCPVVLGDEMEFYRITSVDELKIGYKGILEPCPSKEGRYIPGDYDFMLVPGTVFDRQGNRIGYGKGFYDKYLSGGFPGKMAAVAFSFQIVENGRIPTEPTDHKINCIVTENEIIRL